MIVCWGEVLWDIFSEGPRLGGATSNVAVQLARLGHRPALVSRVGDDGLGERAVRLLRQIGVDTSTIQKDPVHPTGSVTVTLNQGEPTYSMNRGGAWQYIQCSDEAADILTRARVFCFGALCQRDPPGRAELYRAVRTLPDSCIRVADLNVRPGVDEHAILPTLEFADIIKVNDAELELVKQYTGQSDPIAWLLSRNTQLVAHTLGSDGCRLHDRNSSAEHSGFPAARGGDHVGAGDAFVAVLVHGVISDWPLPRIARSANHYASYIASVSGGTPDIPKHLIATVLES